MYSTAMSNIGLWARKGMSKHTMSALVELPKKQLVSSVVIGFHVYRVIYSSSLAAHWSKKFSLGAVQLEKSHNDWIMTLQQSWNFMAVSTVSRMSYVSQPAPKQILPSHQTNNSANTLVINLSMSNTISSQYTFSILRMILMSAAAWAYGLNLTCQYFMELSAAAVQSVCHPSCSIGGVISRHRQCKPVLKQGQFSSMTLGDLTFLALRAARCFLPSAIRARERRKTVKIRSCLLGIFS